MMIPVIFSLKVSFKPSNGRPLKPVSSTIRLNLVLYQMLIYKI